MHGTLQDDQHLMKAHRALMVLKVNNLKRCNTFSAREACELYKSVIEKNSVRT